MSLTVCPAIHFHVGLPYELAALAGHCQVLLITVYIDACIHFDHQFALACLISLCNESAVVLDSGRGGGKQG